MQEVSPILCESLSSAPMLWYSSSIYSSPRWGVSRTSTRRWAEEAGVSRIHLPRPGYSQQLRDQVLETYRKKGLAAACREHGVDKNTVYK